MERALEELAHGGGDRRPERRAPALEALRRPLELGAVGRRQVVGMIRVPALAGAAGMRGDPDAVVQNLDGARGEAHVDPLAHNPVGHAVAVLLALDVIVEVHLGPAPLGVLVARGRERPERGPVEGDEALVARIPELLRHGVIDLLDARPHGRIRLAEGGEGLVAQRGEDPALGHLDADLGGGFVARLAHPGRQNRCPVVLGELLIALIGAQLVGTGRVTPLARLSGTRSAGTPPKYSSMRAWAPSQSGSCWVQVSSALR